MSNSRNVLRGYLLAMICLLATSFAAAQATLSATSLSFGSQAVGTTTTLPVILTNTGTTNLTVSVIGNSGANPTDFSHTSNCGGVSIAPNGTCTIQVRFTPSAIGSFTATLNITDNAPNSPQSIAVSGTGASLPVVTLSPTSLTFSATEVNTTVTMPVVLTNTGLSNLSVSAITNGGTNATNFTHTSNCGGVSIAPNATCAIQVSFTPTATGSFSGTLTITDNAGNSPQSLALSGTGANLPAVTLSPTSLSFAATGVNATTTIPVLLTNTGTANLTVSVIGNSGANPTDFSHTSNCGGVSIAPNGTCIINVRFTPPAVGSFSATLNITDNATNSPQSISLTGTGANLPVVSLSATSLSFPATSVGSTSTLPVVVTNTGLGNLSVTAIGNSGANPTDFSHTSNCGGASIAPSGTCTIQIKFTPSAAGTLSATLNITDNAGNSPQSISLSGTGSNPSAVSLSATSLSFPATSVGSTSTLPVVVTNTGLGNLSVIAIGNSGANPTDFSHTSNCGGASIAPSGTCTIQIKFTPSAAGTLSATLNITDNAGNSPQSIALSGSGVNPTSVTLVPGSLVFGSQNVGTTSASQSATLTNTGSSTLGITSIGLTGANASSFFFANSCGSSLAAATSCTIHGHFTPTATGALTAAITVTGSFTGSPQSISLSGTGVNSTPLTLQAGGSLPAATTNVAYNGAINASGGSGSGYVFTVNGAQVPTTGAAVLISDGISVSSTGGNSLNIVGIPTAAGTVTLASVMVKDSAADSAGPDTYTIAVNSPGYQVSGVIYLYTQCGTMPPLPTFTVSINTTPVQTTTTDSSGNYSFASVPNGTYTISPSITGPSAVFSPAATANVVVNNNPVSNENFGVAFGYTVTGTVSYSGTATGRIYVELGNNSCGNSVGTSIAAPGAFTIRGVTPGVYTLSSWMDSQGFGQANASNPTGTGSNLTVSTANLTGAGVTLSNPGTVTLSNAPSLQAASGFNEGVVLSYNSITNSNGVEIPSSYTVQWSTSTSFASPAGSATFAAEGANGSNVWFLSTSNVTGLSVGDTYYFRAQGVAGTSTSPWSSTVGPVTIVAPTAANTVSGTVSFTGTATGPLYVGFYQQSTSQIWVTQVGSKVNPPVSGASYSVQVPDGNFGFFGLVDQANNGMFSPGDISNNNGNTGPSAITISGSLSNQTLALPNAASVATVGTSLLQQTIGSNTVSSYSLNLNVYEANDLPVTVTLTSGPNVINPVDMGLCTSCHGSGEFSYSAYLNGIVPSVGDLYTFAVTYSNGTTATVSTSVTGWNGTTALVGASQLATLISPAGSGIGGTPSFDWTYPANAGSYVYQFQVCCGSNGTVWQIPGNNSNTNGFTSSQIAPPLVWGVDPTNSSNTPSPSTLSSGANYSWSVQTQDNNNNSAQAQMNFETAPGPVSLPAAGSNPLPSGLAGEPYSGALNASGGAGGGNYYFTVNGTTIPTNMGYVAAANSDGLTFANSGGNTLFVGGTPTTAESVSLTIEVFDTTNSSDTATVTYTVTINTPVPVSLPTASSNPLGSALVSVPYGGTINASGGSGSYSFTVNGTTVPTSSTAVAIASGDGLTASNGSGNTLTIGGTPAATESVSLAVTVTDTFNSSDTASVTYTLPVISPPTGVNNGNLQGTYVCKTNGFNDSDGARWATLSRVVLDGNGNMTSGNFDTNGRDDTTAASGTITGTYSIGADNNGLSTTTTVLTAGGSGSHSQTWALALTNAGEPTNPAQEFRLIETDDVGATPSGLTATADCYLASTGAFAVSTMSGKSFAFGIQGENGSGTPKANVGRFTASTGTGSGGTITSGYLDGMHLDQTGDNGGAFTGSYTAPNGNGRLTLTITPTGGTGSATFAAYIIDANRMFLLDISGDSGEQVGDMRTQQQASYSGANVNGAIISYGQGYEYSNGRVSGYDSGISQGSGNGAGSLTINQNYQDSDGNYQAGSENGATITFTFDSSNPGRATLTGNFPDSLYAYFFDTNSAFTIDLDSKSSGNFLEPGWLEAQTQTTFTDAALAGNYLLAELHLKPSDTSVGEAVVTSTGSFSSNLSTAGQNDFSWDSAQTGLTYSWLTTTYGAFSIVETGQTDGGYTCMVITSTSAICMEGTNSSAKMSILQQ